MKVYDFLNMFEVVQELSRDIDILFSLKLRIKDHLPNLEQKVIIIQNELNSLLLQYGIERENQKGTFDLIPETKPEYDSKVNEILNTDTDCDFYVLVDELKKSKIITAEKMLKISKILKEKKDE